MVVVIFVLRVFVRVFTLVVVLFFVALSTESVVTSVVTSFVTELVVIEFVVSRMLSAESVRIIHILCKCNEMNRVKIDIYMVTYIVTSLNTHYLDC